MRARVLEYAPDLAEAIRNALAWVLVAGVCVLVLCVIAHSIQCTDGRSFLEHLVERLGLGPEEGE